MNFAVHAKNRHSAKAFDPTRKIPEPLIDQLRDLLRYSPSSANCQPWHFYVASSFESKTRIAKSTEIGYPFNHAKILDASHIIVMCARVALDDGYLEQILLGEDHDQRFTTLDAMNAQRTIRQFCVNLHRYELKDVQHWIEKQVYLALGTLLLGASGLNIDACAMDGFDNRTLDQELGLRTKGLTSVIVVSLGYRSRSDFNAKLPKSRLPHNVIFTDI
ncbi:oxygen-insensitive NAD(P)H nitroreductase [Paraburkholderia caribensis]|uniref:oxygen-insensitive NAD(P)H nitroreductase n=1 Tax=Paraburkholderia caribensis TaxID=75105 RepID=UPI00398B3A6B